MGGGNLNLFIVYDKGGRDQHMSKCNYVNLEWPLKGYVCTFKKLLHMVSVLNPSQAYL